MNEVLDAWFELKRNWETPFTTFYAGHGNDGRTWAKLFGVTNTEFISHLMDGTFSDWLDVKNK